MDASARLFTREGSADLLVIRDSISRQLGNAILRRRRDGLGGDATRSLLANLSHSLSRAQCNRSRPYMSLAMGQESVRRGPSPEDGTT